MSEGLILSSVGVRTVLAAGEPARGDIVLDADDDAGRRPSADDTIEYIADMLFSLEEMARRNDLQTLAGIIDLAHEEARLLARKQR
jgi:hypothetical protein